MAQGEEEPWRRWRSTTEQETGQLTGEKVGIKVAQGEEEVCRREDCTAEKCRWWAPFENRQHRPVRVDPCSMEST